LKMSFHLFFLLVNVNYAATTVLAHVFNLMALVSNHNHCNQQSNQTHFKTPVSSRLDSSVRQVPLACIRCKPQLRLNYCLTAVGSRPITYTFARFVRSHVAPWHDRYNQLIFVGFVTHLFTAPHASQRSSISNKPSP
jgi:hypothetical protein